MKKTIKSLGMATGLLLANLGFADVVDTGENVFTVESKVIIKATPAAVYAEIGKVARWWDPQHTWSGSAKNLTMDLRAGGCFCEKLKDGGSVQHGRVVFAKPGSLVRLDAALGPLQDMAVTGVLTFKLEPGETPEQTRVTMTYRVAGAFTMDSRQLAPGVDQVMRGQLERMKAFGDGLKSGK
jgi:uncharacterized protein YndB with AHSA1/START domain